MILPTKHISFSQSLLGFGAYILTLLDTPKSADDLWKQYLDDYNNHKYSAKHTFDNLILTLIFLYSTDTVSENNGIIKKCN